MKSRNVLFVVFATLLVVFIGWTMSPKSQSRPQLGVPDGDGGPELSLTPEELVKRRVRNLTFEKPGRRLVAARNLGHMGADAANAIPYLEKYSNQELEEETGFPTEEDRVAFKEALEKIRADMKVKDIDEPDFPEVPAGKPGERSSRVSNDPRAGVSVAAQTCIPGELRPSPSGLTGSALHRFSVWTC